MTCAALLRMTELVTKAYNNVSVSVVNNNKNLTRDARPTLDYAMFSEALYYTLQRMKFYIAMPKQEKQSKTSKKNVYHQAIQKYHQEQEILSQQGDHFRKLAQTLYHEAMELYYYKNNDISASLFCYMNVFRLQSNTSSDNRPAIPMHCEFDAIPTNATDESLCKLPKDTTLPLHAVSGMMQALKKIQYKWLPPPVIVNNHSNTAISKKSGKKVETKKKKTNKKPNLSKTKRKKEGKEIKKKKF